MKEKRKRERNGQQGRGEHMKRGRYDERTEERDRDRVRERGRLVLTPVVALMYNLI